MRNGVHNGMHGSTRLVGSLLLSVPMKPHGDENENTSFFDAKKGPREVMWNPVKGVADLELPVYSNNQLDPLQRHIGAISVYADEKNNLEAIYDFTQRIGKW